MDAVSIEEQPLTGVTLPRQKRSLEAWARVLDAGVEILENDGYRAFTIAAICDRASVAPRFIYDRVDDKDALFLAVYEYRLHSIRAEQEVLVDRDRWQSLPPAKVISLAIDEVGQRFRRHSKFLRTIILVSSEHDIVRRRGVEYKEEFEGQFVELMSTITPAISHPDAAAAIRLCFDLAFSAWIVRVAYGTEMVASTQDDAEFSAALGDAAVRTLLGTSRG